MTEIRPPESLGLVTIVPWLYWTLRSLRGWVFGLYFRRIEVTGWEHLPTQGPMILAPKHYSRWDPIVVASLVDNPMWYMTKSNQFAGIQGWLMRRLGAFPVDVEAPKLSSFRFAIALLHAHESLVVFPEGGIEREQPVRSLKSGLARLVMQAEKTAPEPMKIPIVPIAITYEPDASWGAIVRLHICSPLITQDDPTLSDVSIAQELMDALRSALLQGIHWIESHPSRSSH